MGKHTIETPKARDARLRAVIALLLAALEHLDAHVPDREGLQPVDRETAAFLSNEPLWRAKDEARNAIKEAKK